MKNSTACAARLDQWSDFYVGLSEDDLTGPERPSACWELARQVYRGERGVFLSSRSAGSGWRLINPAEAEPFDLVVFEQGGVASHVGTIVRPWEMLHLPESRDGAKGREASRIERFDNGSFLPRLKGVYRRSRDLSLQAPPLSFPDIPDGSVGLVGLPFINPETAEVSVVPAGQTLAALVDRLYPATSAEQRARMRVLVGRADLPRDRWAAFGPDAWPHVTPHPKMLVAVEALPGAIPWSKLVALLAITATLAAGQYWLGPALALKAGFAAGTFAYNATVFATTAALATGATLLVNALMPKPGGGSDRQNYAAGGWQNQPRPFQPVPDPLGKMREAPAYGAFPYMTLEADGNLYVRGLFVEAIGQGVASDRRFGDTPIDKFDEGANPVTVEEAFIQDGDPWPFATYDHTVVPTDGSTMGATFFGTAETSEWVERVAARGCTSLEAIVSFPRGLYTTDESSGDINNSEVSFEWEYAPLGTDDWTAVGWSGARARERTTTYTSFRWEVPLGDYRVRTRKTGRADWEGDDFSQADYVWMALQGHRPEAPIACRASFTATAFRVRATDQLQGTINTYNRVFSRKARTWNGTVWSSTLSETSNPAAAYLYKLQSGSLAVPYPDAEIDLAALGAWYDYCDDNGLEYHSTGAEDGKLTDVLNVIAQAGRARTRRFAKKWSVVVDRPQEFVKGHVTPRNGWAISKVIERLPEANGFHVTFSPQELDYPLKTRVVPFPGLTELEVTKPLALQMPWATDPEQVYREAMRLYYILFELRLPVWRATASWDHMSYGAGDRAMVDDGLKRSRVAALVTAVVGNMVVLDEEITMEDGTDYEILFRTLPAAETEDADSPPALSVVREVITVAGRSSAIVLSGTGTLPAEGDLAIFGEAGDAGIDCIVKDITAGDELTGELTLWPHAPELDALVAALVVPEWDGRVGAITGEDAEPPENVGAAVMVNFAAGETLPFLRVFWDNVPAKPMQIGWRIVGGSVWSIRDVAPDVDEGVTATVAEDQDYEVSARVRNGAWADPVAVDGATLLLVDDGIALLVDADSLLRVS